VEAGSVVRANAAALRGGGLYNRPNAAAFRATVATFEASTVTSNVAGSGGGIYNGATLTLLAGTSVTANAAEGPPPAGGGVFNAGTFLNAGDVSGNTPDDVAP
jgi:hypothetical protein